MWYEDHCNERKVFLQSKDYVAKVIVKLFPGSTRRIVSRNGQKYVSYDGIRRSEYSTTTLEEPAEATSDNSFIVPTIHERDEKLINVAVTIADEISMTIATGDQRQDVDLAVIDVTKKIPVTRPEKALVQIAKSLRLCRGVISKAGSPGEESWGSILTSEKETRMRSSACQAVIPWLSNSDACGPCRTYHKRKVLASEKQDTVTVTESGDEALLEAVMKRFNENGEAGELGKLLKSQLNNTNVADPRERRWTPEMIQLCLTIYCRSPRAYADLKSSGVLVLPSQRLLQYYKNSVDQAPGINQQQLDWMVKEAASKNVSNFGKRGGLVLDEMSIQDDIQIVRKGDGWVVVGMVDNGKPANDIQTIIDQGNKTKMATHVLQFVFQGFTGFRWPVAYFATDPATTHQLYLNVWELVEQVESRGFTVEYVMMDGGSANRSLTSLVLGESPREQLFTTANVYDFTRSISFVQDIKHCFKKVRNGIESSKMENQSSKKGRFLKLDGQPIVWDHFEGAFNFNSQSGLRIHRHLTKEHITLTPSNKMRNNLATQVLDKEMLYLMKAYQTSIPEPEKLASTVNLLESTSVLAEFFLDQNRPVSHKDPRLAEVQKALDFFNGWETSAAEPRHLLTKECRDDLNCAVTGFLTLCDRVLVNGDLLKPGYFNSDIVENFFCQQRGIRHGCNTNPTVLQYGPAVNAICLGQTTVSRKSNSSTSAHYFKATTPGKLLKR